MLDATHLFITDTFSLFIPLKMRMIWLCLVTSWAYLPSTREDDSNFQKFPPVSALGVLTFVSYTIILNAIDV